MTLPDGAAAIATYLENLKAAVQTAGTDAALERAAALEAAIARGSIVAAESDKDVIRVALSAGASFSSATAQANAAILSAVLDSAADGTYIKIERASGVISLHPLGAFETAVVVDWGENDYVIDLSAGDPVAYINPATDFEASEIRPLLRLVGRTTRHDLEQAVPGDERDITVPANVHAQLNVGDVIYLSSDDMVAFFNPGAPGSHSIGETNVIEELSPDGVTVTLRARTESWGYATNPTLDVLHSKGAGSVGGRFLEVDYDGRYGGVVGDDFAPNIIRIESMANVRVTDMEFVNINLVAVSLSGVFFGEVKRCKLTRPQRPAEGGHGNLVKCQGRFSSDVRVTRNVSIKSRHLVDWVTARDCYSSENVANGCENPLTWHGLGSNRCHSYNDSGHDVTSFAGIGRRQFAGDKNIKIVGLTGTAKRRAFRIYGTSQGIEISGCDVTIRGENDGALIALVHDAAADVSFRHNKFRVDISGAPGNSLVWARQYFGDGSDPLDQHELRPRNLEVIGNVFTVGAEFNAVRVSEVDGVVDVRGNNYVVQDDTDCVGLLVSEVIPETTRVVSIGNSGVALNDTGSIQVVSVNEAAPDVVAFEQDIRFDKTFRTPGEIRSEDRVMISGADGASRQLVLATDGSARWNVRASGDLEAGGNVGSRFELIARDDAGDVLHTVMFAERATGEATFTKLLQLLSGLSLTGGDLDVPHGLITQADGGGINTFQNRLDLATGLRSSGDVMALGPSGQARQVVFATDQGGGTASVRWNIRANNEVEAGSETGSDLEIVSRDDDGSYRETVLKFDRDTGVATFSAPPRVKALNVDEYTVATLPTAASLDGRLVRVSDGDAGSRCFAYSDGSNWLRIPLGAAVATS